MIDACEYRYILCYSSSIIYFIQWVVNILSLPYFNDMHKEEGGEKEQEEEEEDLGEERNGEVQVVDVFISYLNKIIFIHLLLLFYLVIIYYLFILFTHTVPYLFYSSY